MADKDMEEFRPSIPSTTATPMNKLKRIEDEDMEEEDEDEEEREIIMAAEEESFLLPPVSAAIVPVGQSRKGPLTTAPPNRSTVTVQPDIPSASRPSSAATQPPRYEHVTLYPHVSVKSMSRTGSKLSLGELFFRYESIVRAADRGRMKPSFHRSYPI